MSLDHLQLVYALQQTFAFMSVVTNSVKARRGCLLVETAATWCTLLGPKQGSLQ
jgi:hypothetical protein